MIDKKEFKKMASEMADFDEKREEIIKKSREILKSSKQAIYDVHRNDLNYSKKKIDSAKKIIDVLKKSISKTKGLDAVGAFNAGVEEWVEAVAYFEFAKNGNIPSKKSLNVSTEVYLGGLSDLTGELARRAVAKAIEGKKDDVKKIRDTIEDIYGQFLKFNFRNSDLRKKSDSIKWNLKKAEEVLYDVAKK
ncbi:hypothetical protein GOV08_00050 [Candidatus Woesearchaeota archaeon]|nr:hypothetical protein [Candidatus Woesearchaeota archaeon]